MANISIDEVEVLPEDGIVKIWWWRKGSKLNESYHSKRPIWDVFSTKDLYKLCRGEHIDIPKKKLKHYFREGHNLKN